MTFKYSFYKNYLLMEYLLFVAFLFVDLPFFRIYDFFTVYQVTCSMKLELKSYKHCT